MDDLATDSEILAAGFVALSFRPTKKGLAAMKKHSDEMRKAQDKYFKKQNLGHN